MTDQKPGSDDWSTMLASLEAAFKAAGIPVPLTLAQRVVEMIKRHWTQDGKLAPEYEREKALQLVEEAIDPLAAAHLEHAEDLEELKRGQDQVVELIFRVLRELEAGRSVGSIPSICSAAGEAPSFKSELQSVYLIYGDSDRGFAEHLRSELNARGVKTWFFALDAVPGSRIQRHQHHEIGAHDRVVLCCSTKAMQNDDVLAQVEDALEREHEEGASEVLIPVVVGQMKFEWNVPSWWPKGKEHIYTALRRRVSLSFSKVDDPDWGSTVGRLVTALRVMP